MGYLQKILLIKHSIICEKKQFVLGDVFWLHLVHFHTECVCKYSVMYMSTTVPCVAVLHLCYTVAI